MDQDQGACLDFTHLILSLLALSFPLSVAIIGWKLRPIVIHEFGPAGFGAHEALPHGRPPVAAGQEAQTPVLGRRVLERVPEAHGARRVRVQERAVLVRGHGAADLGLLADDHALQAPGVAEPQRARDRRRVALLAAPARPRAQQVRVPRGVQQRGERRRQRVQGVPDLVDGARLGLGQPAPRVEGVLLEEEPHLVARRQEVVVPHVRGLLARAEPRHRVVRQGKLF